MQLQNRIQLHSPSNQIIDKNWHDYSLQKHVSAYNFSLNTSITVANNKTENARCMRSKFRFRTHLASSKQHNRNLQDGSVPNFKSNKK